MMSTKKIFLFISMLGLIACSNKTTYKSLWQANKITIDGNDSEWQQISYYNSESKLGYTISNDSNYIYFCFKTIDEQTQLKIIHAGMQIWIDTLGKKNKKTGILFPFPNNKNHIPSSGAGHGNRPEHTSLKDRWSPDIHFIQFVGFKSILPGPMPVQNKYGILVNINWDTLNYLIYEAAIPFNTFYKKSLSATDSNVIFSLTVVVNAIHSSQRNDGKQPFTGMPPDQGMQGRKDPSGGEGYGGGPGGGPGENSPMPGNMNDMNALTQPTSFCTKFNLSVK